MEYGFLSRAGKFLQEQKKHRRWMMIFLCLAGGVTLGTVGFLKLYGQAMTHKVKVLDCQYEVHEHTDDCYEENEDGVKTLVCGYADYVIHVHNDDCYNEQGDLVCRLEEHGPHEHNDDCYKEERVLICGETETKDADLPEQDTEAEIETESQEAEVQPPEPEAEAEPEIQETNTVLVCEKEEHTHTEGCYPEGCQLNEHVHGDGCFSTELTCTADEHTHGEGCYEEDELVCAAEEHTHEDGCWTTVLSCAEEEHEHTEACSASEPICGLEEHSHADDCYEEQPLEPVPAPEETVTAEPVQEETEEPKEEPVSGEDVSGEGHIHTDDCYETEKELICGGQELHIHDESCYSEECFDEEGNLIEGSRVSCGLLQLAEHVHTEECFKTVELTPEEVAALNGGAELHVHAEDCYDEEGNLICGHDATHIHGLECYDEDGSLICGHETAHIHGTECYDEEGNLICGHEVQTDYEQSKVYECEDYIVEARYNSDAAIPEEAEFLAEQITPETDEERYASREAEYQEMMGNETASMKALLRIGFYVEEDGEKKEIEPEAPVEVTVQFLGEDGLAEGNPITIVHFAEDGTEKISGSDVKDNSTTFTMESFSEVAIGYGSEETQVMEDKTVLLSDSFEYENDAFHVTFHMEGEALLTDEIIETEEQTEQETAVLPAPDSENAESPESSEESAETETEDETDIIAEPDLHLEVELLDENSEAYTAYANYAEEQISEGSRQLLFQVMRYSLGYGDRKLDLSNCKVTAQIRPTENLKESVKDNISQIMSASEDDGTETKGMEIVLTAIQSAPNKGIYEADSMVVEDGTSENASGESEEESTESDGSIWIELVDDDLVLDLTGTPNPKFTVQYYAYLDRVVMSDQKPAGQDENDEPLLALPVIDTSKDGNGTENAVLPKNGTKPKVQYLELESPTEGGKVRTERVLTEVYKERQDFEYYKQPSIKYMDALTENTNYELAEIWILRDGIEDTESIKEEDWKRYQYSDALHFTNRDGDDLAAEGSDSGYIYIQDPSVIRLVYNAKEKEADFSGAFYDYDISDGYTTSNGVSVMDTKNAGINTYTKQGDEARYAFGNQNCGTAYGEEVWNNSGLNKGNKNEYKKCTFGLVTGHKGGNVIFSPGISAPQIFGTVQGKEPKGIHAYNDGVLYFNSKGDTYTLSSVSGAKGQISAGNLEVFRHPVCGGNTHTNIFTNSFWPMDNIYNKDMHFGENGKQTSQKYGPGDWDRLPAADDGLNHNCFFGMSYQVSFDLVKDYTGPLEYYFFGDDDMWVFLDDKLVCDIGGVHSSVGEYVNLWDYLEVNESDEPVTHTLSFFYTERGASGSTCWMQFTLPSVSKKTPETSQRDYGKLRVEKSVYKYSNGTESPYDTEDEFVFKIELKNAVDDYSYTKYEKDGTEISSNLVLRDGSVFTLKNGQYIEINYLPVGTEYTITEQNKVLHGAVLEESDYYYETDITTSVGNSNPQTVSGSKTAGGTIQEDQTCIVQYKNIFRLYALPETGGSGLDLYTAAGALCMLLGAGFMYRKKFRGRRV